MFIIQQELHETKSMWNTYLNTYYIRELRILNVAQFDLVFCILCQSNLEEEVQISW